MERSGSHWLGLCGPQGGLNDQPKSLWRVERIDWSDWDRGGCVAMPSLHGGQGIQNDQIRYIRVAGRLCGQIGCAWWAA